MIVDKQFFDFSMNNLPSVHFDINRPVTFVTGDSATGKTFVAELLSTYAGETKGIIYCSNSFSIDTIVTLIDAKQDKLFLIDRYDMLIRGDDSFALQKAILSSDKNKFILFGRDGDNLFLVPDAIKQLYFDEASNTFLLVPYI